MEKVVPRSFIKQDLFGFADLLAMNGKDLLAIQVTADHKGSAHLKHRQDKILAEPRAALFVASGGKVYLHGWRKGSPDGSRRKIWMVTNRDLTPLLRHKYDQSTRRPLDG